MNKFLSCWETADLICPVEAACPPTLPNFSTLFSQAKFDSFTASTPFSTNIEPRSLCAQVNDHHLAPGTASLTTQHQLLLEQLTKLASTQSSKLTPPCDQNPVSATISGSGSFSSSKLPPPPHSQDAASSSIPVHQQQQKQLSSFLSALATNTTAALNTVPTSQQHNSLAGNSAAVGNILLNEVIQKTTSDILVATNSAMAPLANSAIGICGDIGGANTALQNGFISSQQQPPPQPMQSSSAHLLGILAAGQQQSLPPSHHLLGSSGSNTNMEMQKPLSQQQNPAATIDSTAAMTQSTLLQMINEKSSKEAAASNTFSSLDAAREQQNVGGQQSAFELVQKASIQHLLNQKQMIDQQIIQLSQLTPTNTTNQSETACSSGQIHHQQQPQQTQHHINILMQSLVQQQQQQSSQQSLKESKPIPLWNAPMDLDRFRRVSPYQWSCDDVVAWILDVARSHNIPCENISLMRFANLNGMMMLQMKEQDFKEYDQFYGSLLFNEFCKACSADVMKNWMGSSPNVPGLNDSQARILASIQVQQQQQQTLHAPQPSPNLLLTAASQFVGDQQKIALQQNSPLHLKSSPIGQNSQQQHLQQQLHQAAQQQLLRPLLALELQQTPSTSLQIPMQKGGPSSSNFGEIAVPKVKKGLDPLKIRKNKDGRPRKRSQHTKGNKLWEFIRDALKDPKYCPSVVRWEDPNEGVFRIVESERLAYLWGQKKNNIKMTYEKLSRAMRTYYEKEILVPVPKCGLYPKKLVYKFGPSAHGWRSVAMQQSSSLNSVLFSANGVMQGPLDMNNIKMDINVTTC